MIFFFSLLTSGIIHLVLIGFMLDIYIPVNKEVIQVEIIKSELSPLKNRRNDSPSSKLSGGSNRNVITGQSRIKINKNKELDLYKQEQDKSPLEKKEFLYSGYYERVRRTLLPIWKDILLPRYKKEDLLRNKQSNLITIMNSSGLIIKVILIEGFLIDRVNIQIETRFLGVLVPNPPKNLIDKDGYIRIYWRIRT